MRAQGGRHLHDIVPTSGVSCDTSLWWTRLCLILNDKSGIQHAGHAYNAGLMLGQRRRRWTNIKPALVDCLVLAVVVVRNQLHLTMQCALNNVCAVCTTSQHKTLNQSRLNAGPTLHTLTQHSAWTVSCLGTVWTETMVWQTCKTFTYHGREITIIPIG